MEFGGSEVQLGVVHLEPTASSPSSLRTCFTRPDKLGS